MKKILFVLAFGCLSACVSQQNEEVSFDEPTYAASNGTVMRKIVVPPENIETQPDEFREALQSFKEIPTETGISNQVSYMETLFQDLQNGLLKSGVQLKKFNNQIDLIMPNKTVFGGNQKKVQKPFETTLSSVAQILKRYDQVMIQIIGYTDESNSVLGNQSLSLQKADVIADFLKDYGIEPARIITDGVGADDPVSTDKTPEGREANRRVEMTLINLQ